LRDTQESVAEDTPADLPDVSDALDVPNVSSVPNLPRLPDQPDDDIPADLPEGLLEGVLIEPTESASIEFTGDIPADLPEDIPVELVVPPEPVEVEPAPAPEPANKDLPAEDRSTEMEDVNMEVFCFPCEDTLGHGYDWESVRVGRV
jgi:hypothetical protein